MTSSGDVCAQRNWQETLRGASKKMPGTANTNKIRGRKVSVTSDFANGCGGRIPVMRHDLLFRNTGFARTRARRLRQWDSSRGSFPDFSAQIAGRSAAETPPPVDRQPQRPTPWATTAPLRKPPTLRTTSFRFTTSDDNVHIQGSADKDAAPEDTVAVDTVVSMAKTTCEDKSAICGTTGREARKPERNPLKAWTAAIGRAFQTPPKVRARAKPVQLCAHKVFQGA
eukprot:GEMP01013340.1.p2 GENE.GEMP01013340.1~~GEMP01013340.1.p2  ORF type:complete len:226 (+),score=57.92 GEMP01013340.1:389-1066(+)